MRIYILAALIIILGSTIHGSEEKIKKTRRVYTREQLIAIGLKVIPPDKRAGILSEYLSDKKDQSNQSE